MRTRLCWSDLFIKFNCMMKNVAVRMKHILLDGFFGSIPAMQHSPILHCSISEQSFCFLYLLYKLASSESWYKGINKWIVQHLNTTGELLASLLAESLWKNDILIQSPVVQSLSFDIFILGMIFLLINFIISPWSFNKMNFAHGPLEHDSNVSVSMYKHTISRYYHGALTFRICAVF